MGHEFWVGKNLEGNSNDMFLGIVPDGALSYENLLSSN
jgi:hypothetical protein